MSVFIDRKYLLQVSPKLFKFTQKKSDLYNFRCPFCGDSQKNKSKCRGYVYRKQNDYFYMCHNCSMSTSFYNFLNKIDSTLIKQYALERYTNGETGSHNYPKPSFDDYKTTQIFKKKLVIPTIDSLPDDHFAKIYVNNRKIPNNYFTDLYFANDFKDFVNNELKIEMNDLKSNDPRLVIPFYDIDKNLIAIQGRALGESKLRYITVKLQENNNKIFGLDRINVDSPIYVVEGPLDSLFLSNTVATADSNLTSITTVLDKSKVILIYDNEPRNKEIVKKLETAIENHYSVVIWPEMIESKDINDMILDGFTEEELIDIIEKNTFVNLRAKMEFINWKKV